MEVETTDIIHDLKERIRVIQLPTLREVIILIATPITVILTTVVEVIALGTGRVQTQIAIATVVPQPVPLHGVALLALQVVRHRVVAVHQAEEVQALVVHVDRGN